ncbi:MAG: glycosyltransferase family 39 protein [Clostridiales bacterium]|nr:glycosyltransferase family 39 protein [Clostridiales bacterium]
MKRLYNSCLRLIEAYYWIFFALLTLMIGFLCFRCLGIQYIDSWDEARHGISAYEMMQNGNYLINTFMNEPDYWNVKPPLSFLSIAAGFAMFGYTAVGLRFFSALAYLLASVCTGLFARRYGKLTSLLTMGFLAANYFPFKAHLVRAGDADSLYLLLFTLAMLAMLKIREDQRWLYACGLCFSLAFLTKSFHAGMIAAVGGLFLLLSGELKRIKLRRFIGFLACSLLPMLIWAVLRYQYDGAAFFQYMYEADIAGRTAAGGLEGHGFPFNFYLTSIFWNFDYIYGWLTLVVLLGILYLLIRPLRETDMPMPRSDTLGILLWLLIPLLGFSLVSTKLMWYVYPCTVPLCLLAAVFLGRFLTADQLWSPVPVLTALILLAGSAGFIWNNYEDNVRGAHSNDLQTFLMEQFDQEDPLTGSTVYLDAYDPFLYGNTTRWEQNNRLLAMMEGDLNCQDGGAQAFMAHSGNCLLILSVPFLETYPELEAFDILADNGQYLLIQK